MSELVSIVNNQAVVSSRQVAEHFGKEHKNVLASIRDILVAENSATKFFLESNHEYRGQKFPEYLMNRDGFSLLVMGFTGREALQWKMKYIAAFNAMEAELSKKQLDFTDPNVVLQLATKWKEEVEARKQAEEKVAVLTPKAEYTDTVLSADGGMSTTQIAKDYGRSAKWLNKILQVEHVQYKQGNQWLLYQEHADKGYTVSGTYVIQGHAFVSTYWTQKGRRFIYDLIREKYGLTPKSEVQQNA